MKADSELLSKGYNSEWKGIQHTQKRRKKNKKKNKEIVKCACIDLI